MDKKKVVVIIGALMMAVVTAMIARSMFAGASAPQAEAAPVSTGPKVLVARKPLPVGTIVDAESLVYQPWPKELIESAYYIEGQGDMKSLVGTVVRYAVTAGQPVTRGALVGPQDRGFLAAALGPGMRAVTVPVNAATGVAGFVFPGDRVDMVLTQEVIGGGDGAPLKVSETVVRNARVLATDQRFSDKDKDGKPNDIKAATNVTIEVTPRIAEKVAVSQSVGTLSLVLRSIADNGSDFERAVAAGEVKLPKNMNPADERKMMASMANRPTDVGGTYTTGGDVSRFQRRSVPGKPAGSGGGTLSDALKAMMGGGGGAGPGQTGGTATPGSGPHVKVARGNDVNMVPVGGQ